MTRRNFYILGLWLPVSWPVIVGLGEAFLHAFTWHQMSRLSGMILLSGMFGGVQYLFFAVLISVKLANKDIDYIKRAVWVLPLIFTILCSVAVWCFFTFMSMQASHMQVRVIESEPIDVMAISSNIATFSLAAGYGYLAVLQAVLSLLETFEYVED